VAWWSVLEGNLECGYGHVEGVSKSFRTDRLERELQMVQLSATRCSCIAILWVSIMSVVALTLCVASQWVFIVVYFVMTQSGNFWIHLRTYVCTYVCMYVCMYVLCIMYVRMYVHMRVYPKVSGLAAWSENCKWYSSLPLGAVVSLLCE
jgi:hypothetical protein